MALLPNVKLVPLNVTLNKLGLPVKIELAVNVIVPAEAVSDPVTERFALIEKLDAVLMDAPEKISTLLKLNNVPELEIVLDVPLKVIIPAEALNEFVAEKFPNIMKSEVVDIEPETVR